MTIPDEFNTIQEATEIIVKTLKPLSPEQRQSVLSYVANLFGNPDSVNQIEKPKVEKDSTFQFRDLEEFVFLKKTDKEIERVAVLAYFLEKQRNQHQFKTADLEKLNFEAAGRPFGNIHKAVNNATIRNYYFAPVGNGYKRLTPLGRLIVEALPDKKKVSEIIKEHKPPPKRKASKKKASSG